MPKKVLFLALLLIAYPFILSACGAVAPQASQPSIPTVLFKAPESGSTFKTNDKIVIRFSARDVDGVNQVEMLANGEPIMVQPVEPAVNAFSGQYTWIPEIMGNYIIELRAFSVNGNISEPGQLFINVESTTPIDTPTVIPTTAVPTVVVVTDTPTPVVENTPTAETIPTETPTPEQEQVASTEPLVTVVSEAVFVRFGPGSTYADVGKLSNNETAVITGRNEDSSWWQIVYPAGSNQRAWVSSDPSLTTATETANSTPIVEVPPLPADGATPAPTPTPQTTPTTPPENNPLPVINSFTADKQAIRAGEAVKLSWNLENAKEAFLRFGDSQEGVISPGEKTVFPQADTTYTLIARNDAGEVTVEVTIAVDGSAPLLGAPAIYRFTSDTFEFDDDGDESVLRWDLANAKEAFLEKGDDTKGIVSPGEELVSPNRDKTYKLIARNDHGTTTSELTITFGNSAAANGSSTPAINSFTVDRTTVSRGGQVTVSWDLANAKEAYLSYKDINKGVPSPASETTSIEKDTTFRLEARNDSGKTISELTVRVQ